MTAELHAGGGDESLPVHETNASSLKTERRFSIVEGDFAPDDASSTLSATNRPGGFLNARR
jgi:hypothetical protein